MTRSELVAQIAQKNPHLKLRDAERIVGIIFEEISAALARGDRVELRGFGTFATRVRNPRQGRNPRTGAAVQVIAKTVPFFRTGKMLNIRLNQKS